MQTIGRIFESIIDNVRLDYESVSNDPTKPYYEYGHPLEIIDTLTEKTNDKLVFDKYPLICLFLDATETIDERIIKREITLDLVICAQSEKKWKALERTVETFEPILYPIYESLMKHIKNDGVFSIVGSYDKIDRYSWGKNGLYGNTANLFNDYIDAIEIKNLKLEILKNCNV